jgi:hypothetical protein
MASEKNMDYYLRILPEDLIKEIYAFLSPHIKYMLNKNLYIYHHITLKNRFIVSNVFNNYVHDIIRKDLDFIFQHVMNENWKCWIKPKKHIYKNTVYSNYIYLLDKLCIDNESSNCRNILQFFLDKSGLSKNQHKNNIIKLIKRQWRN